jgi:hypothetical protein
MRDLIKNSASMMDLLNIRRHKQGLHKLYPNGE